MPQEKLPFEIGEIIVRNGKKYRFMGLSADGQAELRPVGDAEEQSALGGFARPVAQGATFGFSDELRGAGAWT